MRFTTFVFIASVLLTSAGAACAEMTVNRMMEIIHARLAPARRERVIKLWSQTAAQPAERAKLETALEALDKKMKPDWTGLSIGGGVTALASGVGAGMLAAKLGAAGAVAGPVGVVAGIALGGLISYGIHKYHQKKALEGGILSRTGRKMGFAGRGLDGDLTRVEDALKKADAPPAATPAKPRSFWHNPFKARAPGVAAPAGEAPVRRASADDLNTDDLRNSGR